MRLIKNELFKIIKSNNKNIIILAFIFLLLWSSINNFIVYQEKNFLQNMQQFYSFGIPILIPFSIGVFTLSVICDEYTNKSIKYLLSSKYSNYKIIIAKFIAISIYTIIIYLITVTIYFFINYIYSDVSNIYINFKKISGLNLMFNILESNFYILLYIVSIIAMCLMLGMIFKRHDVSLLIFLMVFIGIFSIDHRYLNYTLFVGSDAYKYIGVFGSYSDKLVNILSSLGSVFFSLFVSFESMDKHEY